MFFTNGNKLHVALSAFRIPNITMRASSSIKPQLAYHFATMVAMVTVSALPVRADEFQKEFVLPIEKAHNASTWRSKDGVQATIRNSWGDEVRFEGTMLMNPTASKTRLELGDGTVVVFDGKTCWLYPPDAKLEHARFHSLTWPYFLAAPMKLRDPGSHLEDLGKLKLMDREYDAA